MAKFPGERVTTKYLIEYIFKNPNLSAWQLAKRFNCSSQNLSSRLKKLSDQGLVSRQEIQSDSGRKSWKYFT